MFRLDLDRGIARLTLDRPEARNAIPLSGWEDLRTRLDEAADADSRLLVIAGAGGAFCAGADLGDFPLLQRDEAARVRFREAMRGAFDRLAEVPMPTIARIEGACYGAGVALALACDLRIAGPHASFAITPAKLGISYPLEDVHRLVDRVGAAQAARLLFSARSIDAAEAARIGLVEEVGDLEGIVAAIAANEPASLAALKQALRLAAAGTRSDGGQDRAFDALFGGEALARRLEALRRK